MVETKALNPEEISSRLKDLPNWKQEGKAIVFFRNFPNYLEALEFVYKVGQAAEAADHHPDIVMNYKKVTVRYWTHTVDGISPLDFKMALKVEAFLNQPMG